MLFSLSNQQPTLKTATANFSSLSPWYSLVIQLALGALMVTHADTPFPPFYPFVPFISASLLGLLDWVCSGTLCLLPSPTTLKTARAPANLFPLLPPWHCLPSSDLLWWLEWSLLRTIPGLPIYPYTPCTCVPCGPRIWLNLCFSIS